MPVSTGASDASSLRTERRFTASQFAVGDKHSNTAENFFSIFKRGVVGTYHQLSEAHMHRYAREFDFRYNSRD